MSWGRGRREEERREGGREGGRGGEGVYSIPVEVVDGVAPVIFNVPTETRETHPNIQPRHLMHYIMSILLHHYNVYMLYDCKCTAHAIYHGYMCLHVNG